MIVPALISAMCAAGLGLLAGAFFQRAGHSSWPVVIASVFGGLVVFFVGLWLLKPA